MSDGIPENKRPIARDSQQHETPRDGSGIERRDLLLSGGSLLAASALRRPASRSPAQGAAEGIRHRTTIGQRPNIVFIMGDDVGWFNVGAYHRGMMSGKTPNLDKLASQGMLFTDYYAEASCTAGRAAFITGEIPLRTGLTTVGQAGADVGMPAQACTHCHRAQGARLCHRTIRQEPPRRPEQVPADAARLR